MFFLRLNETLLLLTFLLDLRPSVAEGGGSVEYQFTFGR